MKQCQILKNIFFLRNQNDILKQRVNFQVQDVPQKVLIKYCQSTTIVKKLVNSYT